MAVLLAQVAAATWVYVAPRMLYRNARDPDTASTLRVVQVRIVDSQARLQGLDRSSSGQWNPSVGGPFHQAARLRYPPCTSRPIIHASLLASRIVSVIRPLF